MVGFIDLLLCNISACRAHGVVLPLPPPRVKLTELPLSATESSSPDSPSKRREKKTSGSVEINKYHENLLAVVLKLLGDAWETQKKRCDLEVKARLKQKNQHLLSATESFARYKSILISTLCTGAGKKKAQNSHLNSTFVNAFMFTLVNDGSRKETATPHISEPSGDATPTESSAAAGSAIGGWFTALAGTTTAALRGAHADNAENVSLKPVLSLSSSPIVLYYCACLVTTTPGTLYVTRDYIYIQYGLPLLPQTKTAYPISALDSCLDDTKANLPTVLFSFFKNTCVVSITPLAVDCELLRSLVYSVVNFSKDETKSI